jgi:predicted CopG family antitoxin
MHKKLTITVDEHVYRGLRKRIGPRRISQFIEDLVRPHVISSDIESGYAAMAADEEREKDALEFTEGVFENFEDRR